MGANVLIAAVTRYGGATTYTYGMGAGHNGAGTQVDCSGLVYNALKDAGYAVTNFGTSTLFNGTAITPYAQANFTTFSQAEAATRNGNLQIGDLLLFKNNSTGSQHIGVFYGYDANGYPMFYGSQNSTGPAVVIANGNSGFGGTKYTNSVIVGALRPNDSIYTGTDTTLNTTQTSGTGLLTIPGAPAPAPTDLGLHYVEIKGPTQTGRLYDNGVSYTLDIQTGNQFWSVPTSTGGVVETTQFAGGQVTSVQYIPDPVTGNLKLDASPSNVLQFIEQEKLILSTPPFTSGAVDLVSRTYASIGAGLDATAAANALAELVIPYAATVVAGDTPQATQAASQAAVARQKIVDTWKTVLAGENTAGAQMISTSDGIILLRPDGTWVAVSNKDAAINTGSGGLPSVHPTGLQTLTSALATVIDTLALIKAIQTGQPLPIVASGLRFATHFSQNSTLAGASNVASGILSVMSLDAALKRGDALGAITSGAQAVNFGAKAYLDFAAKSPNISTTLAGDISRVLNGTDAVYDAAGNVMAPGQVGVLPMLNLVNNIANGDGVGAAISTLQIINSSGLMAIPGINAIAMAYAAFQMIDSLFSDNTPPEAWGNAHAQWVGFNTGTRAMGQFGGLETSTQVYDGMLSYLNQLVVQEQTLNPGSPLGIIANRLPSLNYRNHTGFSITDIDPLTGEQRNPGTLYDLTGRPYNAPAGSVQAGQSLTERMIRDALERSAIAPLWEVQTAALQTLAGDPLAGLTEEERAGRLGKLAPALTANPSTGSGQATQTFRPVALDLNGDGIQTTGPAKTVAFDVDNSGYLKNTAWLNPSTSSGQADGFLFLDRNLNGQIDSGRELFSNAVVGLGLRGLNGMRWIDANYDGQLTALDPVWNELKIWQDANGNGAADTGEVKNMTDLGITALNYGMGTFTRNGTIKQMASPDLTADAQGISTHIVPEGIIIQTSQGQISLLATRVDDKSAITANRDGVTGYEDTELLISSADLLANDTLAGLSGQALSITGVSGFTHGTGYLDANGIIHYKPDANYYGAAGFNYQIAAPTGQTATATVDITLQNINDAPTATVDQHLQAVYGYAKGVRLKKGAPILTPYTGYDYSNPRTPVFGYHSKPIGYIDPDGPNKATIVVSDIDNPTGPFTYKVLTQPQKGSASVDANGNVSYTNWIAPNMAGTQSDGTKKTGAASFVPTYSTQADPFVVEVTDPLGAKTTVVINSVHTGAYSPNLGSGGGGKKPISIDLGNDGFGFTNVNDSNIFFDVNSDGFKHRIAWPSASDGLLAFDANGDGVIDQAGEVSFAGYLNGAQTDLQGLAAFDSNGDGIFSALDSKWSKFGVWQDADQDGITDVGEFKSLDELGIASVSLAGDGQFQVINGQTVHGVAKLHKTDGSTLNLADVTLQYSSEVRIANADGTAGVAVKPPFAPSGETITGTPDKDLLLGNYGNTVINALEGDDVVMSDIGNDAIDGGAGNDTIYAGGGNDLVIGGTGDDVVFAGLGDDVVLGGDGNDALLGEGGNDVIFGGAGNDMVSGGDGNNVLSGDAGDDQVYGGTGNDALFGGIGNDELSGMEGSDRLDGGAGNDLLDGGAGADTLAGGTGDDIYAVDNIGDAVTENAGEGTDTVRSSINYTLGANVENLTLTGANVLIGVGNELNNVLEGNNAASILAGGTGNDTYVLHNAGTTIVENAGEGTDTVEAWMDYTLGANIENGRAGGWGWTNLTGNELDNTLTGNAGNNVLDGGTGADTLAGGKGGDTYVVDNAGDTVVENAGEGVDTVQSSVSYILSANVENLTLTGTAAINGTGNALDNVLTGNSASNTLLGGAGNDTYVVDAGDVVIENAGEGVDTVKSSINYTLGANVEKLTLTGTALTGTGNELDNVITGNAGNNTLNGGAGADTLIGGAGDDTYIVDNPSTGSGQAQGDVVVENAGEGVDTVEAWVDYTLGANIENGRVGGWGWTDLTGNELNNTLTGNTGNNVLDGGLGADTLAGGLGDDTYVVDNAGDVVTENAGEGVDTVKSSINYALGDTLENITLIGTAALTGTGNTLDNVLEGNDAASTLAGGLGNDTYVIHNAGTVTTENAGEGTDTVEAWVDYTLGANIENGRVGGWVWKNLTGNELNNTLTGSTGNNVLDGGLGADTLAGGLGDDTYVVDNVGDVVTENAGEGTDTVKSSINYALGDTLENITLIGAAALTGTGNTLDNVLEGNNAASTLIGGLGNDTYVIHNAGTVTVENAGEGVDTVEAWVDYTLGANIENGRVGGWGWTNLTGNDLNNTLTGNTGNNVLDGGLGADTLAGGTGDDTYVVDSPSTGSGQAQGDVVIENAGEGVDTVRSGINYTLGANVENLTLTGAAALTGTGNELDNVLEGNNASSTLIGGLGNDTYVIHNAGTVTVENAGEGTDTVETWIDYTLGANIENGRVGGWGWTKITGNELNNVITGNSGDNVLDGGAGGNDTLQDTAGGNDTYLFGIGSGQDTVHDVGGTLDTIQMGAGVWAPNIEVRREGDHMTLGIHGTTDTLTLKNWFLDTASKVEQVKFADGTIWDAATMESKLSLSSSAWGDYIAGTAGADTMAGGLGDDTYVVNNVGDVVIENPGEGNDTVETWIDYTLAANVENGIVRGWGWTDLTGNELNNTLTGNTGNNILDAGLGADTMAGGVGNDTYVVDNAGDVITENAGEGVDTVKSSINYALGDTLENITLIGTAALTGTGNTLDNVLEGNDAASTLIGGLGNDTYVIHNAGTVTVENAGEGVDTAEAWVDYTLGANIENGRVGGWGWTNLTGNALNNVITGNTGNNVLDGGLGADTLAGGIGDDTYIVDNAGDIVNENAGEGTDTVRTSINYTLGANIEKLILTGTAALTGTGTALDDVLEGNDASSTLIGGTGNDTYIIHNAGTVTVENAGEGVDTVEAWLDYTLGANIENGRVGGWGWTNLTGNALNNVITGNTGNNVLDGGLGADTLAGGIGDDTYVVDNPSTGSGQAQGDIVNENAGEGTDTVKSSINYTLGANAEDLTLVGTDVINGTGNELNNVLTGNAAANILTGGAGNDALDGGAGADTLIGGTGNDIYIVDNAGDVAVENAGEGVDTVEAWVDYTLAANIENARVGGFGWTGITGNDLNNELSGSDGNNMLDGGLGADTLIGGLGNDTYVVDNPSTGSGQAQGDVVIENAGEGTDTVKSSINYTLGANVENLTLIGTAALTGTGNELDNVLTGNAADNTLSGGLGNDTLDGGVGADTLLGGAGNDTYLLDNIGDVVIENAGEGIDTVVLSGVDFDMLSDNVGIDLDIDKYTLGANIENVLVGGWDWIEVTGNELDNVITGNIGNNVLDGGLGADTLAGGTGNDTYVVDNAGDVVTENAGEGVDTVKSSINYTLGANVENLTLIGAAALTGTGNTLDNVLDGNDAASTLVGGLGNDTYVIHNAGTVTVENAGEGVDTAEAWIDYTLGANIENGRVGGWGWTNLTGNDLNNTLTGNTGNNVLDGGLGADTLAGGVGDDTYVVDNAGDVVTENAGEGVDTVRSGINYTLGANVEKLTLTGAAALTGTGNELDNVITGNTADNALNGGAGNDVLDGGVGADTLAGGVGDDTYVVDNVGDVVTENAGEGTDTVEAWIDYTLGANIENARAGGWSWTKITGNDLNNVISGNSGDNVLDGGAGDDTLQDMAGGNDTYLFGIGSGQDTVYDVGGNLDTIQMGAGVWAQNVEVRRVGDNMTLGIHGTTDTLTLKNWFLDAASKVEQVKFADGTVWDAATMESKLPLSSPAWNDYLAGTAGADTMAGGLGDDTYVVNNVGDVVIENPGEGTDTVEAWIDYTLAANVENGRVGGWGWTNLTGNDLNNTLTGNTGNNVLDGGLGADTLAGGIGDDTYVVDNAGDAVTENVGEGVDTVKSSINYTLGANVENLTLTGASVLAGTGNATDNVLEGNNAASTLVGGLGNDTYVIHNAGTITAENAGEGVDTAEAWVDYTLGANIENGRVGGWGWTGVTGNALNNVITGNTGNNILDGGLGADTLAGGVGDDTYVVDNAGDVVTENAGEGMDTVQAGINYTLGANVENLTLTGAAALTGTGNELDNVLEGNNASSTLIGGLGNDTYVIHNAGTATVENAGEGVDTVEAWVDYTLGANIENARATSWSWDDITGNELDNVITGGSGNNILNGGLGADTLIGLGGDDTYVVDNAGDTVIENANEGIDTAQSSVSHVLSANVENLTLTGTVAINGTGNDLDNVLTGNSAANTLAGGLGNDTFNGGAGAADIMIGGLGNDTYIIRNAGDVVVEDANGGIDTVETWVDYTLAANVENVHATSWSWANITGNDLDNLITGGGGNNLLNGGAGMDFLEGMAGNDTLTDTAGKSYLNGGAGDDTLTGGAAHDFLMGGSGNDTINAGDGADVIAFNRGDGQDIVNGGIGTDNTITLGGGIRYTDLALSKMGNDLILEVGNSDQITLSGWYDTAANYKNVLNLQMVTEAMAGFDRASSDPLLNKSIQDFDFTTIVNAFDQARGANANFMSWSATNSLLAAHLSGSDMDALGGDLAYLYGKNSSLAGFGQNAAQSVLGAAQFGVQAQAIGQPTTLGNEVARLA